MELRKEYAQIAEMEYERWEATHDAVREVCDKVALACQALADRPMKELTDAEIDKLLHDTRHMDTKSTFRFIEAAIHAKQREPGVVKFRAARCKSGRVEVFRSDCVFTSDLWEWLEPAQEFEVKLP